ncbi:MAG: preprotein translocase subunit SecA, partial [Planctomycetes bacterium]|nr:preprotein translocase subunit SecA [Planctomycetota bacterium]
MTSGATGIFSGLGRLLFSSRHGTDRYRPLLARIVALEPALMALSDAQLRKTSLALRYRARGGEPLLQLLPEAYALVREAGRRTLDMRHYDVQLLGGIALHHRAIAEMQTGEGKTLTATLPMYLAALPGRGAHLATVNDYLARRDAETMRPLYAALGMTIGVVETEMTPPHRREAYACDITYGTAKEFGFDFLRDRLAMRQAAAGDNDLVGRMLGVSAVATRETVQREHWFALVDEADSVLIDEARTPLVISAPPGSDEEATRAAYQFVAEIAPKFEEVQHYRFDHKTRTVELLAGGRRMLRSLPQPETLNRLTMAEVFEMVEQAVLVCREYQRDRDYIVRDGEVVIVDEFTGRLAEGRKWRAGLHQAIEAREGVEVTGETAQAARLTVQDYFASYEHLAGMSGTVSTSSRELKKIYDLAVEIVPTNRPPIRQMLPVQVFANAAAKWAAIVKEVVALHQQGRPVLIGTRSIDKSQQLSALLTAAEVQHQVLNAHHVATEAKIVAQAGQKGRVTVSTNMAGRGTDITLGPGVAELGGLHVIGTELHESQRIDRQLIGRCGRQGDP